MQWVLIAVSIVLVLSSGILGLKGITSFIQSSALWLAGMAAFYLVLWIHSRKLRGPSNPNEPSKYHLDEMSEWREPEHGPYPWNKKRAE